MLRTGDEATPPCLWVPARTPDILVEPRSSESHQPMDRVQTLALCANVHSAGLAQLSPAAGLVQLSRPLPCALELATSKPRPC